MSSGAAAFLDRAPGEDRATVFRDGRPERLLIAREGDATPRIGARYAARVEAVSERMGLARLDLGEVAGTLRLRGVAQGLHVGERLEVEVAAEPVRGKPSVLRRLGPGPASAPGLLAPPSSLEQQLQAFGLTQWTTGEEAREQADLAQDQVLAQTHLTSGGVTLTLQPTLALTAVDVDLAETGASLSVSRANLSSLEEVARLLRLKAIGGLIAIDLIGFPKDERRLHAAAQAAFARDGQDVAIAPVSRFGVMELAKPHLRQPLHELLLETDGRLTAHAAAHATVRALQRQGEFNPGARLVAGCAPEVVALAGPWVARLGSRFSVRAELGAQRWPPDISAL